MIGGLAALCLRSVGWTIIESEQVPMHHELYLFQSGGSRCLYSDSCIFNLGVGLGGLIGGKDEK
jgi:hypothetical protein